MTWKPPKAIQSDMFGGDGQVVRFSERVAAMKKPVKAKPVQSYQARQKVYGPASKPAVVDAEVEHVRKTQRVRALMQGGKTYREALEIVFPEQFQEG